MPFIVKSFEKELTGTCYGLLGFLENRKMAIDHSEGAEILELS